MLELARSNEVARQTFGRGLGMTMLEGGTLCFLGFDYNVEHNLDAKRENSEARRAAEVNKA